MHRSSRPAGPISTTFDGARETTSCAIRSMPRAETVPAIAHWAVGRANKQISGIWRRCWRCRFTARSGAGGRGRGLQHAQDVRDAVLAGIAPSLMLRVFLPSGTWPKCLLPEVKFSHVQMQMPLRAMLIDALHAPLEDTEVSFNGCLCGSGRKRTHQRCDAGELTA